jgi:PAS domain S-box-containing protein
MQALIAMGNTTERENLGRELESQGFQIIPAYSCGEAFVKARDLNPDLIISALEPWGGGIRFLHESRKVPQLKHTPFIFCNSTTLTNQEKELVLTLGADAIIPILDVPDFFRSQREPTKEMPSKDNHSGAGIVSGGEDPMSDLLDKVFAILEEKHRERDLDSEKIRECESRYQRLLESVNDYTYTVMMENGSPVHTRHNVGSLAVTGYSPEEFDAEPGLCFRMIHDEDRENIDALIQQFFLGEKPFAPFQHRILHKDGRVRWIRNTPVPHYDLDGNLVAWDGLISDITEYKKLEDQFHHAQKMEAVGVLAGGIAHDFNNILTAMIGYGEMLQRQLSPTDGARNCVDQILGAAERAANLVHGLLAFSRKQVINPRPINISRIISNVERLLSRLLTEDIDLKVYLGDGDAIIMADPGQIDQILMNLVTNARDAMPRGGKLTIETSLIRMDMPFIEAHGFGIIGDYVLIAIADTGIGMDEESRQRIFEPFFTTKPQGKGTGLGLSIVYGIVKQHNGFLDLRSRLGEGTVFNIYFPVIDEKFQESAEPPKAQQIGGDQTILIADDDMQVRNVIKIILSKSGYKVLEAEDGEKAVSIFGDNMEGIDLLILDIVMPKKNGLDAYEEIRKLRKDVKAIFISGYTADVIDQKGAGFEDLNIVSKPVSPNDLLLKIKEAFNS